MDFIGWKLGGGAQNKIDPKAVGLPGYVCEILASRGCSDDAAVRAFLDCEGAPADPFLLPDMDKAVERLEKAVEAGDRILVFGDYDCDGITSTVMLYDYLEGLGADVLYYIPDRHKEGYGLSLPAVEMIKAAGVGLVVTVDNGISSLAEADKLAEYGIGLVVTDHHHVGDTLPAADAVVNPHRADSGYPYKELCGAGVAFKLVCAMEQHGQQAGDMQQDMLEQYGDLLTIGILADAVPVTGENRILVKRGLSALAETQRPGIEALAKAASIDLAAVTGESVCFGIAPRINVTGRIGSVDTAVELLLCGDPAKAEGIADEINRLNMQRRSLDEQILAEAQAMLASQPMLLTSRVITLVGRDWHLGVIGITASRIVERYHKPCIIISVCGDTARGSARSVEGFSIIDAIASCRQSLIKYGGHPMAAGLSLDEGRIPGFIAGIERYSAENCPEMPEYTLGVDAIISIKDISLESVEAMERLAPFGCDNPQPILGLIGCRLESISPIGNGSHIKVSLSQSGAICYAVMFGVSPERFPFSVGDTVDCAVALSVNTYNDRRGVNVRIAAVRPNGFDSAGKRAGLAEYDAFRRGEPAELPEYNRDTLSTVYRYIRENTPYIRGADSLAHALKAKLGGEAYFKTLASLDILDELGLISGGRDNIGIVPAQQKMDLNNSPTYTAIAKR